jgi:hypothetical protein
MRRRTGLPVIGLCGCLAGYSFEKIPHPVASEQKQHTTAHSWETVKFQSCAFLIKPPGTSAKKRILSVKKRIL